MILRLREVVACGSSSGVRAALIRFKVVPPEVTRQAAFGYPGETDPRVTDAIDRWVLAVERRRA